MAISGSAATKRSKMAVKRIILLSPFNPLDIKNWSGTLFYLHHALQQNRARLPICCVNYGLADFCLSVFAKLLWKFGIRMEVGSSTLYALLRGIELTIRLFFIRDA